MIKKSKPYAVNSKDCNTFLVAKIFIQRARNKIPRRSKNEEYSIKSEQFATMALMFRMVLKHFRNYIFALLTKANFMEKEKITTTKKEAHVK